MSSKLSHIDQSGQARMVDVTGKAMTRRSAHASAVISMSAAAMEQLIAGDNKKGDVLGTARIAGIMAAKKCSELIPLCHPLGLSSVDVDFDVEQGAGKVIVRTCCRVDAVTGVEMEALTAASVAALTIYDMCKAVDQRMVISDIQLDQKLGGKSGDWHR